MKYVIIGFPEIQKYMEKKEFEDECYLINTEEGINKYGCGTYFVPITWVEE